MKILNIYTLDYDMIIFESIITEDKLDDFINYYIDKKLNKSKLKFEVIEIIKKECFVTILVKYNSYIRGGIDFSTKPFNIGFEYQIIELDKINNFQ